MFFQQATTQDIPIGGPLLLGKGNQCTSFYQNTTFFFIPYYGNNDNPCYNDTLRKERELSLLPSSTVLIMIIITTTISWQQNQYFDCLYHMSALVTLFCMKKKWQKKKAFRMLRALNTKHLPYTRIITNSGRNHQLYHRDPNTAKYYFPPKILWHCAVTYQSLLSFKSLYQSFFANNFISDSNEIPMSASQDTPVASQKTESEVLFDKTVHIQKAIESLPPGNLLEMHLIF